MPTPVKVKLVVDDAANRITLMVMLQREGHVIVEAGPDVVISDDPTKARGMAKTTPTLLLSSASQIPETVEAMREGVYGYIFLPFQPGEVGMMVCKAAGHDTSQRIKAEDMLRTLEAVESEHILDTLRRCKSNKAEAARVLGIGRNTLWRKLSRINQNLVSASSGEKQA